MARIKTEKNGSRKDVIVSKAATLFREKGYKAASMRDLAEAVGAEAASLYIQVPEGLLPPDDDDDDGVETTAIPIVNGLSMSVPADMAIVPTAAPGLTPAKIALRLHARPIAKVESLGLLQTSDIKKVFCQCEHYRQENKKKKRN